MTARRRLVGVLLAASSLAAAGCGVTPDLTTRPVAVAYPASPVPASVDGLTLVPEASAKEAFAQLGRNSAVAHGQVWTLRQDGLVVGSVQVSQLKGGLSTGSERVRQGIRDAVNHIPFRWFKVNHQQWVGVQAAPQLFIYLWMPPRHDIYVIAQLKATLPDPDRIVADLIAEEKDL